MTRGSEPPAAIRPSTGGPPRGRVLVALALVAASLTGGIVAEAQRPGPRAAPRTTAPPVRRAPKEGPRVRPPAPSPPAAPSPKPSPATADAGVAPEASEAASGAAPPADGGVLEARTTDAGTKVFRFGEVEIEGRLQNPQLVYFLRRVRAEFAAGDLGHRTFLPELSQTRNEGSF